MNIDYSIRNQVLINITTLVNIFWLGNQISEKESDCFSILYVCSIESSIIEMIQRNFNLPKPMVTSIGSSVQNPANNKKIQNYVFNLGEVLGRGNFSQVYKAVNLTNNQTVAIKVIEISKMKAPTLHNLLSSEIDILSKIKHENILNCVEVFTSSNNCYIITELCDSDLETTLKRTGALEEKMARKVICDIFEGLRYLAQEQIVHRDIKIANIFMKNGVTKIADFGFAKKTTQNFKDISIGTPIYMAPEGLLQNIYGPKTDVWAFGVVMYEILHGNPPMAFCQNEIQLKMHINTPVREQRFKNTISQGLRSLIIQCLEVDWRKRPSVFELANHPYVQGLMKQFSKNVVNNENLYLPSMKEYPSGSLTNYPVSYTNLNKPALNQFLSVPKLSNARKTSIDQSYTSTSSRLITCSSGGLLTPTSNSNIKSTNSGMNHQTITTKLSFQQALQLLHYCRLLFKTRQLIVLQVQLAQLPIVDCYGNSIIELICQIKDKLATHIVFSGPNAQNTEKKLRGVVDQYYAKYTTTIKRKPNVRNSSQFLQAQSLSALKFINSISNDIIARKDQIILSVYIKYVYDINRIVDTCSLTSNYSSMLHDVNIEEFLKIKYETFNQTYFVPVLAKLQEIENL